MWREEVEGLCLYSPTASSSLPAAGPWRFHLAAAAVSCHVDIHLKAPSHTPVGAV